jgi:antitoxin (DNA-binding transcriptional repressor) of toxin-antitoxin stability system
MMILTTITDLRIQAKRYFDLVEAGETVRVFRNGSPIADICPLRLERPSWKKRSVLPLTLTGEQLSDMILASRGN